MKNWLFATAALVLATSTRAHDGQVHAEDISLADVGAEHMVMETSADEATQAAFLRGLALLHNFEYSRAAEEFRASQAADPDFVMAYWGEAMTHNHPLWDQQDREAALAALAKLGTTPAQRAAKARTDKERQWLTAVETLYGEGEKTARDLSYLAHMRNMLAANSSDIDVRAFTGLAVLGSSHGGRQIPLYMEAAGIMEEGFITHPTHPGILHYLIHSYDDPEHAPLGLRMARGYAKVAPAAGHAQHMISHIFNGLGMWEDSEKANRLADAVVDKQRAAAGREPTSCGHYNEWLVYALLQQGKDAKPIVDACRAQAEAEHAEFVESGEMGFPAGGSSYGDMALRYGIATGDWQTMPDFSLPFYVKPRFDFAYARMLQARGDASAAKAVLAQLESAARQTIQVVQQMSAGADEISPWIEAAIRQGEAIAVLAEGDTERGLVLLEAAASADAALPKVFGPPPIRKPSYEILGEELLALGRHDAAADAFAKALAFAPNRRLSNRGLAQARAD